MVYSSDIINDLAFLFPLIEEVIEDYASFSICNVSYTILVLDKGFKVLFKIHGTR